MGSLSARELALFAIASALAVGGIVASVWLRAPFALGSALTLGALGCLHLGNAGRSTASANALYRRVKDWARSSPKRNLVYRSVLGLLFGGLGVFSLGVLQNDDGWSRALMSAGLCCMVLAIPIGLGMRLAAERRSDLT